MYSTGDTLRILWISRHIPTVEQGDDLKEIFQEEIDFVVYSKSIQSADEVRKLMEKHSCQDLVVVLPLNILVDLARAGIKPLRARMGRKVNSDGTTTYHEHLHFERINDVKVNSEIVSTPLGG